jgi:hypothetical protein
MTARPPRTRAAAAHAVLAAMAQGRPLHVDLDSGGRAWLPGHPGQPGHRVRQDSVRWLLQRGLIVPARQHEGTTTYAISDTGRAVVEEHRAQGEP